MYLQPLVLDTLGFVNPSLQASAAVDGRTARWARHREERRAELLDVARRLIHTQGPDVTMEDIASASGTSKSIIYRYFADKSQLQRALGVHIFSAMQRRLLAELRALEANTSAPVGTEARIRAMIRTYVETAERSPGVYWFVTRPSDGLNHFLDSVVRLVAQIVPESVPDRTYWAAGAVGFVQGSVDRWMRAAAADSPAPETSAPENSAPDRLTTDQLAQRLVDWLMKGMQQ